MQELTEASGKHFDLDLATIEKKVVTRLEELGVALNLNFWPDNMGMILAAEGVSSRFSLDEAIVKAVWAAVLTDEQLATISSKIENKYRLFNTSAQQLTTDILVLGRLLSRIEIDFKEVFSEKTSLKVTLLKSLLHSLEVIYDEYKRAELGDARSIGIKDYFSNTLTIIINNLRQFHDSSFSFDKQLLKKTIERYQSILILVMQLDPQQQLPRTEVMKLNENMARLIRLDFSNPAQTTIAGDVEFQQTLELFGTLGKKINP